MYLQKNVTVTKKNFYVEQQDLLVLKIIIFLNFFALSVFAIFTPNCTVKESNLISTNHIEN